MNTESFRNRLCQMGISAAQTRQNQKRHAFPKRAARKAPEKRATDRREAADAEQFVISLPSFPENCTHYTSLAEGVKCFLRKKQQENSQMFPQPRVSRQMRVTGSCTCWGGKSGSWMRLRRRSMAMRASSCSWGSMVQMGLGKFR